MTNNKNNNKSDMNCDMPPLVSDSESDYESESDNEYEPYNPPKLPKEPTIEDYTRIIQYESFWVDVKEYSHNLISLYLRECDGKYGRAEANNIIKETGLERLGWKTMPMTEK